MEAKKVLVFPAGSEISFEIVNALKYSKFVELYGGTSVDDHSEYVYKRLIKGFPNINDEDFVSYLNTVIHKYQIDCVYPAHDSASVVLSKYADKIDAQVIITDYATTSICRSKKDTYQFFANEYFVPKLYSSFEDVKEYPVFVKPSIGQGSVGAKIIMNLQELKQEYRKDESIVICEYLPGMEYTVDCFTDKNGQLLVSKIRNRQRVKAGISVRSQELGEDEAINKIANIINSKLHFIGAWFFQVKKDLSGEYKLMEISPRIPGTMGLSRNLGINFPMLTLFVFWGYDVEVLDNGYDIILDRAFYSAYKMDLKYENIYIDFDDTVTLNSKVNPDVVRFLYQEKNKGVKIYLLSKHDGDLREDLKKIYLSEELFDNIIVIKKEEEKADYITEEKAIFIDDSFAERKKVKDQLGIAVFDVDMIESLIDWRV